MKNLHLVLISIFTVTLFSFTQPMGFHTSTTKVELNPGSTTLKFTSKYNTADLEKAVKAKSTDGTFNNAVKSYLNKNFTVSINGAKKQYNYAKAQTSSKVTRVYFEIPNVKGIKSIEIKNTMLVNEFSDQQNFITFNINGVSKKLLTQKSKSIGKVTF